MDIETLLIFLSLIDDGGNSSYPFALDYRISEGSTILGNISQPHIASFTILALREASSLTNRRISQLSTMVWVYSVFTDAILVKARIASIWS